MQKRHLLQIAVLFFSVILMGFSVWAVPGTINYQGRLTDPNGAALEGDYEMGFSLYNNETGGSDIWSETQTVRITNGIYNVQLGAVNPLSMDLFNDDTLYLEVQIDNEVLYPREPLTSTAFAMRAGVADVAIDAGTVGGIQPGDLLDASSSTQTKAGGLNISGRLGIGTDTPSGALHVNGTSILEGTLNIDTKQEGTTTLDQSQTSKQLTSFLNADWQSFTASMEGILTRIEVLSVEAWSWGSTTLRIYEGEGASGATLYEGQYDIGITASDGLVAFDIPIESGPRLSSGSQYTFQIENTDGFVWLEFNNPYAGGISSFGPDRDFWFKTYMRIGYNPGGVVTITPDGNVGIGTTNPAGKLDVNGSAIINGPIIIRGAMTSSFNHFPRISAASFNLIHRPDGGLGGMLVDDDARQIIKVYNNAGGHNMAGGSIFYLEGGTCRISYLVRSSVEGATHKINEVKLSTATSGGTITWSEYLVSSPRSYKGSQWRAFHQVQENVPPGYYILEVHVQDGVTGYITNIEVTCN